MIKVLIADDQMLIRGGFRVLLEMADDITVVGEAEDGAQAIALAKRLDPDVILMDIRMPNMDGIEATRSIAKLQRADGGTDARVLILTTFDLDEYVYEALRAGASGFMLKDIEPTTLIESVRVIAQGDALLAPTVTRRLIDKFARQQTYRNEKGARELERLTDRETEVLALVGGGLSNTEIAEKLFISPATAKTHVSRIMSKLSARDRAQLVIFAYEGGLIGT